MPEAYSSSLDDDTAFERLFLSNAFPLVDTESWINAGTIDPVSGSAALNMVASATLGPTRESAIALLKIEPLAFGAAWKALDILLEYAFEADGLAPSHSRRWTIAEKVAHARAARGKAAPITDDVVVWTALTSLYVETSEVRHSLVHRRVTELPDGSIQGVTAAGSPLHPLTRDEQTAVCYAVQRALASVIDGEISRRQSSDLAAHLDHLSGVHLQPPIGGAEIRQVLRYVVPVSSQDGAFSFDGSQLVRRLQPSAWVEAEFRVDASQSFLADLIDIPPIPQTINIATPPAWLRKHA